MSDDHDHDHPHAPPSDDYDAPPETYYEKLAAAVTELLVEKGVFEPNDVVREVEALDSRTAAVGARVIAHAWNDEAYKARLLADGSSAIRELGLSTGYDETRLTVKENTPSVHHVVVCTLCSCYPRSLLGLPPSWYKSSAYRSRVVREPRAVLAEFGLRISDDVAIHVLDSTANSRFLILPMRPAGTEGWSEEQLAKLLTRESMVGTGVPNSPSVAHA